MNRAMLRFALACLLTFMIGGVTSIGASDFADYADGEHTRFAVGVNEDFVMMLTTQNYYGVHLACYTPSGLYLETAFSQGPEAFYARLQAGYALEIEEGTELCLSAGAVYLWDLYGESLCPSVSFGYRSCRFTLNPFGETAVAPILWHGAYIAMFFDTYSMLGFTAGYMFEVCF